MSWKYIFIAVFATVILAFSFFASSRIKKPIKIALTIVWCACAALLLWKGIKTLDIRILLLFLFSDLFGLSAGCISTLISSQKASEKRAEDLKQALARSPKLREAVSAASDGLSALIDCCARYNCIVLQREGGGTFLIARGPKLTDVGLGGQYATQIIAKSADVIQSGNSYTLPPGEYSMILEGRVNGRGWQDSAYGFAIQCWINSSFVVNYTGQAPAYSPRTTRKEYNFSLDAPGTISAFVKQDSNMVSYEDSYVMSVFVITGYE